MHPAVINGCFHCHDPDHWQSNCPLLTPAATKSGHEERIKRTVERWFNREIDTIAKRRIIEHENRLWHESQNTKAKGK